MIGLDAAGKTTTLEKLELGTVSNTIPTIGFNVGKVTYKNVDLTMWDIGGQKKLRPLWKHYFAGVEGVIFVIDSNDENRIDKEKNDNVKDELQWILQNPDLQNAVFLFFANKQDLPGALGATEIAKRLELNEIRDREWFVQPCVALQGQGLYEGLDWLIDTINKRDPPAKYGL